ncbi:MAG: ChaN family lipoprotein [Candidatus Cloacimonadota bacterium]
MRKILLMILLLPSLGLLFGQQYRIISSRNGRDISLNELAKQLNRYDLIFFGEIHDDTALHEIQAQVLSALHRRQSRLIVSFEMFERDVQSWIDSYLAGEIAEAEFLHESRPWSNYETDYRPLLEFAKSNHLKVLAANIPRQIASQVVRYGTNSLAELSEEERGWIAEQITATPGDYKERFLQTMQLDMAHGEPGDQNVMDRLFYAQCMKDDTMAESIVQALRANPRHKLIHFNGDFHSRAFLGTVERVRSRHPRARIAVISPEYTENLAGFSFDPALRSEADFLIVKTEEAGH